MRAFVGAIVGVLGLLGASCTGPSCSSAICGCWEPFTVDMEITVVDQAGTPVEGIDAICLNEGEAIATSDGAGLIARSFDTRVSPGCGPERCNNVTLNDPLGRCEGVQSTLVALNFSTVSLPCVAIGDDDDDDSAR